MEQIWSVIGQYAFPIVACICMGWYVKYSHDKFRESFKEVTTSHKAEIDNVTTALNNNTIAIQKLIAYIEDK